MKILIIMSGFFPGKKYGGPPVSINNFCTLMREHECFIVTHNHDKGEKSIYPEINQGWNQRDNCKILYLSDEEYGIERFESIVQEIGPQLIYLQGLFQSCVRPCLRLAKKYQIKVLLAPRGELCGGAINIHKWKKIPYIKWLRYSGLINGVFYQSTSDEETQAIRELLKADDKHIYSLANIPSIPMREYTRPPKKDGIGEFVFLSRIHPKKNLLSAIHYFHNVKGSAIFDIYGSIEDKDYWARCLEEIEKLPANIKVEYKGIVSHEQVHETFSRYNAFLFPTLSENYGHVIIESLVVGTPVIISDQTPWTDVSKAKAGFSEALGNEDGFVSAINSIIEMNNESFALMSKSTKKYVTEKLDLEKLITDYQKAFADIYK